MAEGSQESQLTVCADGRWLKECPPGRRHVLIVAGVVAALYLVGVTGHWWPTPDSAMNLTLGRSLAEGRGFEFNGQVRPWSSPALPAILAGFHHLGEGYWIPNLFTALCGLGAAALTYLSLARLTDRRMALAVALATALSYSFYFKAHEILTEMPFVLVFWAVVYCGLRAQRGGAWWAVLTALLSVAAVATRIPGYLSLAALAVGLAIDRSQATAKGRRLLAGAIVFGGGGAAVVAWMVAGRALTNTPAAYAPQYQQHWLDFGYLLGQLLLWPQRLTVVLSEMLTAQDAPPVGIVALVLMLVGLIWSWRGRRRIAAAAVVLYPLALVASTGAWAIQLRYCLPIQPLLVWLALEGLCVVVAWLLRLFGRPAGPRLLLKVVVVSVVLIVACNAPKIARWALLYRYFSFRSQYYREVRGGAYQEVHPVAELIKAHSGPADRIALPADQLSVFHFLTRRIMTPFPGTEHRTAEEAAQVAEFLDADTQSCLILIEKRNAQPPFLRAITTHLGRRVDEGRLKMLFDGGDYSVYQSVPPAAELDRTWPGALHSGPL